MNLLAKNYLANFVYQILISILPLITTPYLARVLGADQIGTYSFTHSIVSYFILLSALGTNLYGQRAVARAKITGNSTKQVLVELLIIRSTCVLAVLCIYMVFVSRFTRNHLLYYIVAIEVLAVAVDISWFYQGIEQFGKIAICNSISKVLCVVCVFAFVKTRDDVGMYAFLYGGSILFGNGLQWIFLKPSIKAERCSELQLKPHIKAAFSLFVSQFAIQVYTVLDKTMIGVLSGSAHENGYYDQAQRLVKALTAAITSVGAVMASRIAIVWYSGKRQRNEEIHELLLVSFRLVFALSLPIAVGLTVIAPVFVPIYWGNGYEPVVLLLQILVWIVPIIGCSNVIGMQLLVPTGREGLMTQAVMVGAGINVISNSLLIPSMNALGAVISSVLAELTVTALELYRVRKELPLIRILHAGMHYLILSLLIGILAQTVLSHAPSKIIGLALAIGICVVVYALWLILSRDPVLSLFKKRFSDTGYRG